MKKLLILIAAALFVAGSVMPVLAQDKAEYSFYGSARMWTGYERASSDTANRGAIPGALSLGWARGGLENQSDSDLHWTLQGTTQYGFRAKWGNIGGHVQARQGVAGDPGDYISTIAIMHGTWNFGPGTLLVGRDVTPVFFNASSFCGPGASDCIGFGYGTPYGYRMDQIKLMMGGLQVALVRPGRSIPKEVGQYLEFDLGTGLFVQRSAEVDVDSTIPKIEAKYSFTVGPAALSFAGGYNYAQYEWALGGSKFDTRIASWILGGHGRFTFGPLYFNLGCSIGQNLGQGPWLTHLLTRNYSITFDPATGTVRDDDADYFSLFGNVGFNVTDVLRLEGGVFWQEGEVDSYTVGVAAATTTTETMTTYYINATWSPAKNVFIIPELAVVDFGDTERTGQVDQNWGKLTYFGIKWQINF